MKKILLLLILFIPFNIHAIETSAESAILMDMDSNRILYAKNINKQRSVASISKIMTAYLAVESEKLDKLVKVGSEIDNSYGSGIYIKKGEVLTIRDLLYGLMLRSGNDASYAIAHNVAGSVDNFVSLMNKKASELNLKNTTFNNPNGLDEDKGNYSTAYDMAILMSNAMKNKDFKEIVKCKKYNLKTNMNTYIWHNKNKLLNMYKYATGGKTGYTKIAKRTLVNTASKDNLNLVAVTLNDGNDFKDHMNLFEYGFNNYKSYKILNSGVIDIIEDNYYKKFDFYIKHDFTYPLSNDELDLILIKFNLEKKRKPKSNMKVGYVSIYLGDLLIHKEELYIIKKQTKKFKLKNFIKDTFK
ncbi:MAG: D-alanyl-D-alanine carboxypeptidase [Bacilli bacterium]|nr:D-alanyl-D-alanine carboxypeptidase [Bacilli bacterium]